MLYIHQRKCEECHEYTSMLGSPSNMWKFSHTWNMGALHFWTIYETCLQGTPPVSERASPHGRWPFVTDCLNCIRQDTVLRKCRRDRNKKTFLGGLQDQLDCIQMVLLMLRWSFDIEATKYMFWIWWPAGQSSVRFRWSCSLSAGHGLAKTISYFDPCETHGFHDKCRKSGKQPWSRT